MMWLRVAVVLGAFAAGWFANGWRLDARHSAEALEQSRAALGLIEQRDALGARLAALNDKHLADLRKAQNETNRLRTCLADGTCGLRAVEGLCPRADRPKPPASPGVDPGAGPEPAAAAGRAYLALRDGIDRASAQLTACQAELRSRASP
jgi:hypothetical protein